MKGTLIPIVIGSFLSLFFLIFMVNNNPDASKESTCQRITDSLSLIIQNRDLEIKDMIEYTRELNVLSRELNRQLNAKQTEMSNLTENDLTPIASKLKILTPSTPNFVQTEHGNWIGIEKITDEDLTEIAKTWKRDLLNKATRRRRK